MHHIGSRGALGARIGAFGAITGAALVLTPTAALAATLDGASMGWPWGLPFAGILLSIALGPLFFPRIWHHHYGKIAAAWSALTLLAIATQAGPAGAFDAFVHAMLAEYLSFIVLLFALFTVAGGIVVEGNIGGRPTYNTATLGVGAFLASFVGTTGASMILIRPLIRANDQRRYNVHVVVFFIFLVGNIGGALTPLGDPPLFVGFLRGVDFFWTTRHLLLPTLLTVGVLLAVFFVLDTMIERRGGPDRPDPTPPSPIRVRGAINIVLVGAIIAAILMSSIWRPGISYDIRGTLIELQNVVRDLLLLGIAALSVWLTPAEHRESNAFSWEPIREVAKLFAAIFICIIPVLAMLKAGQGGALGGLIRLVTNPDGSPNEHAYFWLTGVLSAFLDNAPTYLVFFELAGGNPAQLMTALAGTLAAISLGAVYMGALTYIGNAPNFMVYAIAVERGIRMPSFFGYMLWSCGFLLPVFALLIFVLR